MDLVNPVTGKPLVESLILSSDDIGKPQIMYVDKGDNGEYLSRIEEDPAGFWWNYLREVKGMTEGCVRSFMDSFAVEPRISATSSTMDQDTWIVTNALGERTTTFGDLVDADLSDVEESDVGTDAVAFEGLAKDQLMKTMNFKENFDFGEGDDASRATGFEGSIGNSTNRSVNSKRMDIQKTVNKELQAKNSELEKGKVTMEEEMTRLQNRIRAMEALVLAQPNQAVL